MLGVIHCKYVDEPYSQKLESMGYPALKTASSYVHSFWHNIGVWRKTGRIAVAKTALSIAARCKKTKT